MLALPRRDSTRCLNALVGPVVSEDYVDCLSAPADSIDRAATIHRCSWPYSNSRGTDAGGHHGSRDGPRPQHDAGPYDASDRIGNVLAVHYGTGLFTACGHEPSDQQRR